MAKFINRQEEVLQIQLTPYGKHQFSRGEFNPEYYAYYDEDILYDLVVHITKRQHQEVN